MFSLVQSKSGGTPARKKSKHGKPGPGRPPSKLKSKAAPQTSPGKENVVSSKYVMYCHISFYSTS